MAAAAFIAWSFAAGCAYVDGMTSPESVNVAAPQGNWQPGEKEAELRSAIAKKLEEIYFPHDSLPLYIDKKSETLRLIQHMRDEAHRFAQHYHHILRRKRVLEEK